MLGRVEDAHQLRLHQIFETCGHRKSARTAAMPVTFGSSNARMCRTFSENMDTGRSRVDRGERLISLGCEAFGYRPFPITAKIMKPTS
jgi:hypothetical protein